MRSRATGRGRAARPVPFPFLHPRPPPHHTHWPTSPLPVPPACSKLDSTSSTSGLAGTIPTTGWVFPNSLTRLELVGNGAASKSLTGTLPPNLSLPEGLVLLDLRSNLLSGPIPPGMVLPSTLQKLYLHSNQLNGGWVVMICWQQRVRPCKCLAAGRGGQGVAGTEAAGGGGSVGGCGFVGGVISWVGREGGVRVGAVILAKGCGSATAGSQYK